MIERAAVVVAETLGAVFLWVGAGLVIAMLVVDTSVWINRAVVLLLVGGYGLVWWSNRVGEGRAWAGED